MSKLKEKFPFLEVIIIVIINIFSNIFAIVNTFCWSLANSSVGGNTGLTAEDILIFSFYMGINILIPFFIYLLAFYLSQNSGFLHFGLLLKNNLSNKIRLCFILFIISPMPLICLIAILLMFSEWRAADFWGFLCLEITHFPLSMGFPLMLFFIFEPVITRLVNKHYEKHTNSKSLLKKNYDLRMDIQKELLH